MDSGSCSSSTASTAACNASAVLGTSSHSWERDQPWRDSPKKHNQLTRACASVRELKTAAFGFTLPFPSAPPSAAPAPVPSGAAAVHSFATPAPRCSASVPDQDRTGVIALPAAVATAAEASPLQQQFPTRKRARSSAGPCWFRRAKKACDAEQPSRAHAPEELCTGTTRNSLAATALHADDSDALDARGPRHGPDMEPGFPACERAPGGVGDAVLQTNHGCARVPLHTTEPPDEAEAPCLVPKKRPREARVAGKPRAAAQQRAPSNRQRKRAAPEMSASSLEDVPPSLHAATIAEGDRPARNADIAAFLAGAAPAPAPTISAPIPTPIAQPTRPRRQAAVEAAQKASAMVAQEAMDEAADRRGETAKRATRVQKRMRVAAGVEVGGEIATAKTKRGGRMGAKKTTGAERVEELVEGVFRVGEGDAQKVVGVGKENEGSLEGGAKHKGKAVGSGGERAHVKVKKPRARRALVDMDANV